MSGDRMAGTLPITAGASSCDLHQQGVSGLQHHQQILKSTLARVVPSNTLNQQPLVPQQMQANRPALDTRPIVAKVRVDSTPLPAVQLGCQSERLKQSPLSKKNLPRDSHNAQVPTAEFSQGQQAAPHHALNGDDTSSQVSSLLTPPVSMAPPPLEPCRPVQSASSISPYPLLNGLLPETGCTDDTKEDSGSAALLSPPTSQYR